MEPSRGQDQDPSATDSPNPRNKPNEFKLARQLTRRPPAEVAKALGVSRSTVSRYESGEIEAPQKIIDWLQRNRSQYVSNPVPLSGPDEPRGAALRTDRAEANLPQTSVMAKAAEK
jgi:transcriptional regulator with XRE-family HTH domain